MHSIRWDFRDQNKFVNNIFKMLILSMLLSFYSYLILLNFKVNKCTLHILLYFKFMKSYKLNLNKY